MTVPQPAGRRGRFRLSLAARLGLGFAAIAVVLLLGHAAAQRDMLAAIETLRETQTAQVPLSRAADALTYRVLAFDRAVLAEVRTPAGPSPTGVAEAEAALFASLASYAELQPSASGEVARLRTETQEHTRMGWSLIDVGAQRQAALNGIRDLLDQLTRRISTAFGWDARLPDPALARRAYADLELDLGRLRAAFNGYLVSGPEAPDTLRTATRRLRSTVSAYRDELRRSPGQAWLELVDEDLAQVERLRQEVLHHDASIEALRGRFAESGLQLPLRLDAALAAPASRAVAESAGSAVVATRSAELAIRQLTYLVLAVTLLVSLLTMLAVTRPVKRLTQATRALARGGGQPVRVPPGGPLELDELGEAFNQMAERLAEADQEVSRHQRELEGRVRARTRKLSYLANHDPLSRLPNRRFAFNHLRRAVRAARSRGGGLGLIALDIDNFKVINDNFGHSVGDALLRGVADRLRMLVGERRFIARLGGDEFVITLEDADPSDSTVAMAERIVNGFRAPLNLGGHEILVSVSVGVARLPEHASDASGLARAADAALFRAKALGRNRIATFSHALLEGSETRFMLEQSLRRAVDAGELALVYQPQISLVDGCTDVVEALLRWQRTDGPLVPASEFIAIAEQSGLIIEVGEWVLETAAAAVADWRRRGFDNACVAINVSVHQLLDSRFVDRLTETLARHHLPADAIELELTETAFQTSSSTVESLRRVREGGVGLALDDFGTGYSSLTSLSRLPLRRVKIDRSLVVDAPTSPRAESVARSIIGVCHNLGLGVTVEGIERHDQLAWLAGCGPVHVQGYLIARPMPAAEVLGFAGRSAQLLEQLLAAASPHAGGRRTGNPVVPFRHGPGSVDR